MYVYVETALQCISALLLIVNLLIILLVLVDLTLDPPNLLWWGLKLELNEIIPKLFK
jgi:hypothetical protein